MIIVIAIIIIIIIIIIIGGCGLDLFDSGRGIVVDSCEHGWKFQLYNMQENS